jgi:gluconate 2-dehydrogenase gamma chain
MEPREPSHDRRRFFKTITLVPALAALPACKPDQDPTHAQDRDAKSVSAYRPTFFTEAEYAFLIAATDRLIPTDDVGPGAVAVGVPEFLDRHMQTPYAAGDIWYMQGPFVEAPPEFGYQGRLPVRDLMRVGIKAFEDHCRTAFGKSYATLDHGQQEALLKDAEGGKLKLEGIASKLFFDQLLTETRIGYFADPSHGGNKSMGAWTAIAYPGVRADYIDWVGVRDKPYPLPAVDLAGRRA